VQRGPKCLRDSHSVQRLPFWVDHQAERTCPPLCRAQARLGALCAPRNVANVGPDWGTSRRSTLPQFARRLLRPPRPAHAMPQTRGVPHTSRYVAPHRSLRAFAWVRPVDDGLRKMSRSFNLPRRAARCHEAQLAPQAEHLPVEQSARGSSRTVAVTKGQGLYPGARGRRIQGDSKWGRP
jgi:hypothetical protein